MEQNIETTVPKKDKGFTLVELLIVIVILGILATVTVFAVRGITDKGKTSVCKTDKTTVQTAVEAWFANNGGTTIPNATTAEVTQAATNGSGTIGQTPEGKLVADRFLQAESPNYDVSAAGVVTAQSGNTNGCT